jgi:hypothetical protein
MCFGESFLETNSFFVNAAWQAALRKKRRLTHFILFAAFWVAVLYDKNLNTSISRYEKTYLWFSDPQIFAFWLKLGQDDVSNIIFALHSLRSTNLLHNLHLLCSFLSGFKSQHSRCLYDRSRSLEKVNADKTSELLIFRRTYLQILCKSHDWILVIIFHPPNPHTRSRKKQHFATSETSEDGRSGVIAGLPSDTQSSTASMGDTKMWVASLNSKFWGKNLQAASILCEEATVTDHYWEFILSAEVANMPRCIVLVSGSVRKSEQQLLSLT